MRRRGVLGAMAAGLGRPALAQGVAWPTRPVQVLVGYAAGTGVDSVARFYAERLRERTGQPFVVVNKTGAYGNLAAGDVARGPADGTVMLITPNTPLTVNAHLLPVMPFDPARDLAPVAPLARWGFLLLVNPAVTPVADLAGLTALLRRDGDRASYASGNFGGRAAAELYRLGIGAEAVHVAYRSVPDAILDLTAGRVAFLFSDVVAGLPQVRGGRLRALAVTTPARLAALPDVPTLAEAGVSGAEVVSWFAAMLPGGTPAATVAAAHEAVDGVTRSAAAGEYFARLAAEPFPGTPSDLAAFAASERGRWGDLVRAARITMD